MGVPKSLDYKDFMNKSTSANPTTWDDMYRFFGNQGEITAALVKSLLYQPGTAYSIGAIVYSPNLPAGTIAKCINAGTTGSTEPVWPAVGSAVYDGTAMWLVKNMQDLDGQVNADWSITDSTNKAFIKNKPNLTVYATKNELENGFTTASLTVSGETSVPTPSTENNSKTIANTEFVHGVVNNLVNGAPTALDTLQELATALGNDPNFSTTILNKIGEKESKIDAQIEHEKLQNAIDLCLKRKPETIQITKPDNSGNNVLILLEEIENYDTYNYHRCGGSFSIYPYVRVGANYQLEFPPVNCSLALPYKISTNDGYIGWSTNSTYVPLVVKNNTTNKVYWGISMRGSGHTVLMLGAFEHNISVIDTLLSANNTDTYDSYAVLQRAEVISPATISNGHLVINGSELWIE